VANLAGVVLVSAGRERTCAIVGAGSAKCWGNNDQFRLGDGTGIGSATPVDVVGVTGIVQLSAPSSAAVG
jgi:hypothetical protein